MNDKLTAALALAMIACLSGPAAASDSPDADEAPHKNESRELAETAHREALDDALNRMRAANRLDLDVELPTRTRTPAAGD